MKKILIFISVFMLALTCLFGINGCTDKQFTVTYSAAGGGQIVGETRQVVEKGSDAMPVSAVANKGHVFIMWSDGSEESSRQDKKITQEWSVTAIFGSTVQYAATKGGQIVGKLSQIVPYGKAGDEVRAVPNDGYAFKSWSDGKTETTRKETDVKENIEITAIFYKQEIIVEYKAGEGGQIVGFATQTIKYGEETNPVVARPTEDAYKFDKWSDGVTLQGRSDYCTEDTVFTAYFVKREKATLRYVAGEGGKIEGAAVQDTFEEIFGEYVTAVPDTGYIFEKWSDGKTDAERRDLGKGDQTFTAKFKKIYEGQGIKEAPYLVNDYNGLMDMVNYPFAYYKLTQDIDLSGISYLPPFDYNIGFYGDFNGGNHTIKNLTVDKDTLYPSLFGFTGAGKIHDLNMTGVSIRIPNVKMPKSLGVGAVVSVSNGELENIFVSGEIKGDSLSEVNNNMFVGGLVGLTFNKVTNCSSEIEITLSNILTIQHNQLNVGGLIGMMGDDVTSCRSSGKIAFSSDTNGNYSKNLGGLIGVFLDSGKLTSLTVSDCSSSVEITGSGDSMIGGLIGYIFNSDITLVVSHCSASGNIMTLDGNAGGFMGIFQSENENSKIFKCYATGDVSASDAAGFICEFSSVTRLVNLSECYTRGKVLGSYRSCGFANYITGYVEKCYTTSNVEGGYASGFAEYLEGVVKQCFSKGKVNGNLISMGFARYLINTMMLECFSSGKVSAMRFGCGLLFMARESSIINCYSVSNIDLINENNISAKAVGLVFSNEITSEIKNCYYSGKITINNTNENTNAYALVLGNNGKIINCHWLLSKDSLAQKAIGNNNNESVEVFSYDSFDKISVIADLLNKNQDKIWTNVPNSTPQLTYYVNGKVTNVIHL